jgi:hypothetical protein
VTWILPRHIQALDALEAVALQFEDVDRRDPFEHRVYP